MPNLLQINNLYKISDQYDAFILDLWGVIHDGTHLYPGVHDALVKLREQGKKIAFLSNAPRRVWKVEKVLARLGVEPSLYDFALSSGEAGYEWLANGEAPWGKRYFYIGQEGTPEWTDADILDDLDYTRVQDVKDADFLLNVGFGSEEHGEADMTPLLTAAKALGIPMLCLNPDLEVVKQTGERFACAGVIGQAYQRMGGAVTWFGKPYAEVYQNCLNVFAPIPKSRVLAVGDSLETDIPGAINAGIDSVLVTGGILKQHSPQEILDMCAKLNLAPNYIMPGFLF